MITYEVEWPTISNLNVLVSREDGLRTCGRAVSRLVRAAAAQHYRRPSGPQDGPGLYKAVARVLNKKVKKGKGYELPDLQQIGFRIAHPRERMPDTVMLTIDGIVVDLTVTLNEHGLPAQPGGGGDVMGFQANRFFAAFDRALSDALGSHGKDPVATADDIMDHKLGLTGMASGKVAESVFEDWLGATDFFTGADEIYVYRSLEAPRSTIIVRGDGNVQVHLGLLHVEDPDPDASGILLEPHNCGTLEGC